MATYRHWFVSLWRDPDDVLYCLILSPDKTEWWLISTTLCGWRCCFVAGQLWFTTRIWEEEVVECRRRHKHKHGITYQSRMTAPCAEGKYSAQSEMVRIIRWGTVCKNLLTDWIWFNIPSHSTYNRRSFQRWSLSRQLTALVMTTKFIQEKILKTQKHTKKNRTCRNSAQTQHPQSASKLN